MKKLLIAAMAASIVMAFTGCGNDEGSSSKDDATTTTTTTAAEESKADDADESKAETEESKAETVESTADAESTAAVDSTAGGDTSTPDAGIDDFTAGKFFSFETDEANWSTAEDAYGNTTVTYIGTDIPLANQTCFLLFNSQEAADLQDFTFDELAPLFVSSMGLGDAFTVSDEGSTEFNGYDAYIINGTFTQSGNDFAIKLILCREDTKLVVIATMAYSDAAEAIQPEFQKVLDTVKIV